MKAKKLTTKIMLPDIAASIIFAGAFIALGIFTVKKIQNTVYVNSNALGVIAAQFSQDVLEKQKNESLYQITAHSARKIDEKTALQENYTKALAAALTNIYSQKTNYVPRRLPVLTKGDMPEANRPFISAAPGVQLKTIQPEAYMAANAEYMLNQAYTIMPDLIGAAAATETGIVIAVDKTRSPVIEYDPRIYDWYTGAKATGGLYWSRIYVDIRGRGLTINCAVPFYETEGGTKILRGVVTSGVVLSSFASILSGIEEIIGESNEFFILDDTGQLIWNSEGPTASIDSSGTILASNYLSSPDSDLASVARSMVHKESGHVKIAYKNEITYIAYHPLEKLNWSIAVVFKNTGIMQVMDNLEQQILRVAFDTEERTRRDINILIIVVIAALVLFLALRCLFGWIISSNILKRIKALGAHFDEISGGNIGKAAPLTAGEEEIQRLADAFNMMTNRIHEYIYNLEAITAEKERLFAELDLAAHMQEQMLSHKFPPFEGHEYLFDIYGEMHPAKEVAGDFYDFFYIDDDHFAFIIADVSGKGIPAALFMIITKTSLKNMLQSGYSIERAVEKVNLQTCENNEAGMFITSWIGILELSSGRLEFVNAGHNPPLLSLDKKPFVYVISKPDIVIGAVRETKYTRREIYIKSGDILFLYTDGITEAFDIHKNMFGNERLKKVMRNIPPTDLKSIFRHIKEYLDAWTGGAEQADDITMLAIQLCAAGTQAKPQIHRKQALSVSQG
ncbi:MAG: SpoIIE family protein phosphatase [Spirochaetaceae bacterium]|jgi:sigma-B regulation protein RsbU (phosphoserine phosphatase)|nr:SpoIIE family protein phosphatase [Spirochaetaceae bacterium]